MIRKLPGPLAALAAITALATPAAAADYTLILYEAPAQIALRGNTGPAGAAYWQGFAAAGEALARAGALKGGAALEPAPAASIGARGNGRSASPSGYFIVSAPDLAAARRLAAAIPAASTGRIDIIAHAPSKTGM